MNNKVLSEILNSYEQKRNVANLKTEQAKQTALSNTDYKKLDSQEAMLTIEIGKQMFLGNSTDVLENQLKIVKKEKEKVLKKMKLSTKDFTPNYECKKCKDTGFVDGKMCDCLYQTYFNKLMELSNVQFNNIPFINDYSTKCFDSDLCDKMEKIKNSMVNFCDNIKTAKTRNIVMVGNTGVGKTFLAKSMAKTVISKGGTVIFMTSFNLNNELLKCHLSNQLDKIKALNNFITCDLLIIDDLGSEPLLKNVTKEYLLILINERLAKNKATIITTNLQPDDVIKTYGQRFASRIFDKQNSALINFQGKDLRMSRDV